MTWGPAEPGQAARRVLESLAGAPTKLAVTMPIVEHSAESGDSALVTFAYVRRGNAPRRAVTLRDCALARTPSQAALRPIRDGAVWSRTYRCPPNFRSLYWFDIDDVGEEPQWGVTDPLNPLHFAFPRDTDNPTFGGGVLSLCDLAPETWPSWHVATDEPESVHVTRIANPRSATSHRVWYRQPRRTPEALAVAVGWSYAAPIPLASILGAMEAAGRIPPTALVVIDASARAAEPYEALAAPEFVEFVLRVVLPWTRDRTDARITRDRTVAIGAGLWGPTAAALALDAEGAGKVLLQSPLVSLPRNNGARLAHVVDVLGRLGYDADSGQATDAIAAISRYQADRGICVDGFFGPLTVATAREDLGTDWPELHLGPAGWLDTALASTQYALRTDLVVHAGSLEDAPVAEVYPSVRAGVEMLLASVDGRLRSASLLEYPGGHDYACWQALAGPGLADLLDRGGGAS